MTHRTLYSAVLGAVLAAALSTTALAETAMQKALADGAKRLTANEIAERLANKTVTFEQAATGDRFLIFYDGINGTLIKPVGGEKASEGFYAVSVSDHVCLGGGKAGEPMRLRCVNVLLIDDMMHKFELDGSLRGRVVEQADGNMT